MFSVAYVGSTSDVNLRRRRVRVLRRIIGLTPFKGMNVISLSCPEYVNYSVIYRVVICKMCCHSCHVIVFRDFLFCIQNILDLCKTDRNQFRSLFKHIAVR